MNQGDYLTYRKASSISLIGLVLQLLITLVVFIYSKYANDYAAAGAARFLATGLIAWGLLLLVFDLHRRERIEAMETEQLAVSGASAASAFDSVGDNLRVASRRLAFVYKWIMPAGGIIIGAINIWIGTGRLRAVTADAEFIERYQQIHVGWALAIGIGMAVVGFVFARFVSGMGKIPAWSNLRAGSAISVAAALVGILLAVGGFLDLSLGINTVQVWNLFLIPIGMIAFGIEIGLNLLLDVYRPRKPGEVPRPSFDSRFLGLLAAPDRIAENVGEAVNYQFGIDVTSSWFYQLLSKWIMVFVVAGVGVGWLMTSLVVVEPHERGLIITNGVVSSPLHSFGESGEGDIGPGLHIKLPWPFSKYETPVVKLKRGQTELRTTTGVRVLQLASNPPTPGRGPILWTENHSGTELLNIVQPDAAEDGSTDQSSSVAQLSLLAIEVPVQYVIRNVKLFDEFAAPGQREQMLLQLGRRVVTQYLGELSISDVLANHRISMPVELKSRLEKAYGELNDGQGTGIEILFVGINGVHPPTKVAPSFERVIIAKQNRESLIEDAKKTQITTLAEIAGSVELASEINDKLITLVDLRREVGRDAAQYIEAELEVQRLIEKTGGEAGEMILSASANRWVRHMSERGRASLLQGQQEAYLAAPSLYQSNMYFDALLEAMKEARVYLTPADLASLKVRLELQDKQVGTQVFDAEAGAELQ
ncbi:MAG: SPFH domain-containing protein [Phycisphaerales bacterium]|nr:SPFH domain-containing protein [Phycisphaerales bacterium]